MALYAIKMLKNQLYPLEVVTASEFNNGDLVLVQTEKGEEVAQIYNLNEEMRECWANNNTKKNKNTKFTTRIRIVADILIHPNVILNPFVRKEREENNKSNGPFNYPNSEGCQVLEDQDFSKLTGALDDLGFNSGDKIKVDVCEVTIRQGAINNE